MDKYLEELCTDNARAGQNLSDVERTAKAEAQVLRLINAALPEGEQITIEPAVKPTSKGLIRVVPESKGTEKHKQAEPQKAKQKETVPAKSEKKSIRKRLKQAEEVKREARQQQIERGKDYEPNRKKKSYEQDL